MTLVWQLLLGTAIVVTMMFILWLIQRFTGDAGIVDVGWCGGLFILSFVFGLTSTGFAPRRYLGMAFLALWSLRLTLYIFFNRVLGKEEDGRYKTLRANYGQNAQIFFLLFFEIQALLDVVFAVPFLVVAWSDAAPLGVSDAIGSIIWLTAVLGEATADAQLAAHRADPNNRGKTCRRGLWNYSRHPNYFFEWLHWWTYVFLAWGSSYWWLTLIGPSLMLYFLFRVTGIPTTEAQAVKSRGEDYKLYQRTTSPFVPWFPKKEVT